MAKKGCPGQNHAAPSDMIFPHRRKICSSNSPQKGTERGRCGPSRRDLRQTGIRFRLCLLSNTVQRLRFSPERSKSCFVWCESSYFILSFEKIGPCCNGSSLVIRVNILEILWRSASSEVAAAGITTAAVCFLYVPQTMAKCRSSISSP